MRIRALAIAACLAGAMTIAAQPAQARWGWGGHWGGWGHRGWGFPGAFIGGLALGAALGAYPYYGYGYGYPYSGYYGYPGYAYPSYAYYGYGGRWRHRYWDRW